MKQIHAGSEKLQTPQGYIKLVVCTVKDAIRGSV